MIDLFDELEKLGKKGVLDVFRSEDGEDDEECYDVIGDVIYSNRSEELNGSSCSILVTHKETGREFHCVFTLYESGIMAEFSYIEEL